MDALTLHQTLKDEGYTDQWGLIRVLPLSEVGMGNGLLHTGLLYTIKANHGALTQVDKDHLAAIVSQCEHASVPMLWRSPIKKNPDDNQQWDDYFGMLPALYFAGSDFPRRFLAHAEKAHWSFDIQKPDQFNFRYYYERMPGFVGFVKSCARGTDLSVIATPMEMLQLAGAILWSAFSIDNADSNMKAYCRLSVARKESPLCALASLVWFWRIRRRYGIVGQSFAAYFQDKAHPLCLGDWR